MLMIPSSTSSLHNCGICLCWFRVSSTGHSTHLDATLTRSTGIAIHVTSSTIKTCLSYFFALKWLRQDWFPLTFRSIRLFHRFDVEFWVYAPVFPTRRLLLPRHAGLQGLSLSKLLAKPRPEQPKMSDGKLNKKRSHSDSDSEAASRPKIKTSNSTTVVTDELGMPELRQKALYVDH